MTIPIMTNAKPPSGDGLRIRHLNGLYVAMRCKSYDPNATYENDVKPLVFLDIVVIDSATIMFGGDQAKGTPDSLKVTTPYYSENVMSPHTNIVNQLSSKVGTGEWVGGRIVQGKGRHAKPPWNLVPLEDDESALQQKAIELLTQVVNGSWVNPDVVNIVTGDIAIPGRVSKPTTIQPTNLPKPAPAGPTQGAVEPSPPAGIPPAAWAVMDASSRAAAIAAMVPPVPAGPKCPPTIEPSVWAGMDENTQRAVAASLAGTY